MREGGGRLSEDIPPASDEERAAPSGHDAMGREPSELLIPGLDLTPEPAPQAARRHATFAGRAAERPRGGAVAGRAVGNSGGARGDPRAVGVRLLRCGLGSYWSGLISMVGATGIEPVTPRV